MLIRSGPGETTEPAHLPVWFWILLAAVGAAFLAWITAKSVMLFRGGNSDKPRDRADNASVDVGTFELLEPITKPPRAHSRWG
jgi:hypothetical protein